MYGAVRHLLRLEEASQVPDVFRAVTFVRRVVRKHQRHAMLSALAFVGTSTFTTFGQNPGEAPSLQTLVARYFRSTSPTQRDAVAATVEALPGVTIDDVANAVRNVQLWDPQPTGLQKFVLSTRRGVPLDVHVHVPLGYDPARAYPLLLAFHGSGGKGEEYIHFPLQLLGDRVNEFVVAAPTEMEGAFISSTPIEAHDPTDLVRELKQRYHIDSDRVYANGYSKGGHISCLMGALYTDVLAATVPLAATFATQAGYELMEVMLPNLRQLPTLIVYGQLDRQDRRGESEEYGISGANRYMAHRARGLDVPIRFVELEGVGHHGVRPPLDQFHEMLSKTRPHDIKRFEHWFRHVPQGRLNFVRQTKYQGQPWKGRHLRATPDEDETFSDALLETVKLRLAYIGGQIEGQDVHVDTRHCAEIELLLNDSLIDLNRDITVTLKGRPVYYGPAHRSIRTLLDVAYQDWDFQRLFPVRFVITKAGSVEQR